MRQPQAVATVSIEPLCTPATMHETVYMRDSAEVKSSLVVHFVITDICSYVLTLAMAWFQKQNPALN
jgi:hypothetical protein